MENYMAGFLNALPEIAKNTHIDVKLEGWTAVATSAILSIGVVTGLSAYSYYKYAYPRMISCNSDNATCRCINNSHDVLKAY